MKDSPNVLKCLFPIASIIRLCGQFTQFTLARVCVFRGRESGWVEEGGKGGRIKVGMFSTSFCCCCLVLLGVFIIFTALLGPLCCCLSISCVIFSVICICMYWRALPAAVCVRACVWAFVSKLFVLVFALPFRFPFCHAVYVCVSVCVCAGVIESWLLIK